MARKGSRNSAEEKVAAEVRECIRIFGTDNRELWATSIKKLIAIGEPAVKPLIDYIAGPTQWRENEARAALVGIGEPAIDPLIEALKSEGDEVGYYAECLGEMKAERAVGPLIEALRSQSDFVRMRAAEALGKIGDRAAVGPLIKALEDPKPWVRGKAIEALCEIKDARAIEPLMERLRDAHHFNSSGAEDALSGFKEEVIIPIHRAVREHRLLYEHATKILKRVRKEMEKAPLPDTGTVHHSKKPKEITRIISGMRPMGAETMVPVKVR